MNDIILFTVWLLTLILTAAFFWREGYDRGEAQGYINGKAEAKKSDPKFKEIKRKK